MSILCITDLGRGPCDGGCAGAGVGDAGACHEVSLAHPVHVVNATVEHNCIAWGNVGFILCCP